MKRSEINAVIREMEEHGLEPYFDEDEDWDEDED